MGPLFLIKRLTVFAAVVFLFSNIVLWVLVRADGLFEEPRLATLSNQVQKLSKLQSPKLVLVGGSNLPYGMNSEMLSEAAGLPVMNMGVQASLTLEFMLELIKPHLHSGDVVVFGFEYGMYTSNAWSTPTLVRIAATDIGMMSSMSWRQVVAAPLYLYSALSVQGQQLRRTVGRYVYNKPGYADGLTPRGDYVGHRGKPSKYVTGSDDLNLEHPATTAPSKKEYLRRFRDYCDKIGVQVFVSFAPTARGTVDEPAVHAIAAFLDEQFTVISDPMDYVYPDSAFYDTSHHLIYEMRDVRTGQLIDDLLPQME